MDWTLSALAAAPGRAGQGCFKSGFLRPIGPSINAWNAPAIEAAYQRFKQDPSSVPSDMAAFFQGFDLARAGRVGGSGDGASRVQSGAVDLIAAFRALGHLIARIDPFGRERVRPDALTLAYFGLSDNDLDSAIQSDLFPQGTGTLRDALARLEASYAGPIGVEFMHIPDDQERAWFRARFEGTERSAELGPDERVRLLEQLTAVERFETFLGKRFQGKKRFSIEGAESLIPLLKFLTQRAGELGTIEIILGMAHRGRLSVLKTYLGKGLGKLFTEFKDSWTDAGPQGSHGGGGGGGGDVKYHRGYSGDQPLLAPAQGSMHLSMLNNPSHLESVNAVVMGRCRAKQDYKGDAERRQVVSLLIHGDAALAGQGVVAECLNMSRLDGYAVGGTLHVVINNLVGFTTDPEDGRSTAYCTDVAKMINAPVLHVNGNEPEAVVRAARLAAEYRHHFRKDVFIDLVCFRRYGHNEQDEPAYTQPLLYALVNDHPGTPEVYRQKLIGAGVVTPEQAAAIVDRETDELSRAYDAAAQKPVDPVPPPGGGVWEGFTARYTFESPKTSVDARVIGEVCGALGRVPEGFNLHPKLAGLLDARRALPTTRKLTHADAEMLAIGTLVAQGTPVRLSGQDSRRGTFSQRHGVLRDVRTGERYTPVNHVRPDQPARFEAWDSPLSEFGVMGFDYGYSRGAPRTLVMWEGQFGDFVNGAQVLIDQYMTSSEVKWSRWAGLVLLLPHGHEGQGPEHSSGRLERFLQLSADENIEVVYPSTGAQMFHVLRRQALRNFRKPLIVMTPKKFLRIETSTIDELSTGAFQHLIDDPTQASSSSAKGVKRVVYCTGKVYHELAERRAAAGRVDATIVRIEQLYPFHTKLVRDINGRYPGDAERIWVQEEPRNQGAYMFVADRFRRELGLELRYIGRPDSASPATGSERVHSVQQNAILTEAIGAAPPAPAAAPAATHPNGNGANGSAARQADPAAPNAKASAQAKA